MHAVLSQQGGSTRRGRNRQRQRLTEGGELKNFVEKEEGKRIVGRRMAATVPLPRNLNTTTLFFFSHLSSLPSSLPLALLPLSSPLLVTTATGEGQKNEGRREVC